MQVPPVSRFGLRHKWRALRVLAREARLVRREGGPGIGAQLRSYRTMRHATGASPTEFFRYRMWDPDVPMAERLAFLTWAVRRPLEALINPTAVAVLVQSKLQADDLFRRNGIPTPDRLGIWCPESVMVDAADTIQSRDRLSGLLDCTSNGIVFKREFGGGGDFVLVFKRCGSDGLIDHSGRAWQLDDLISRMEGDQPWLVQRRIRSHPELNRLIGRDELASIRIVTCRRDTGRIFSLPAFLKLPSTQSGVDNFAAGNVAVAGDETGILGGASAGLDGAEILNHPVSGKRLAGFRVPHWSDAVRLVLASHAILPESLRSIGWDVAITPDGPVVLEPNAWWSAAIMQQPGRHGLVRGEFIEFVQEIGAGDLVRLERRRLAADGELPSPHAPSFSEG